MRDAPANFDRVARVYRWAEYIALGPLLQQTRTHLLPRLTHARRAVLFGDGDGRFLAELLEQNPQLHAAAVDTSDVMLRLLGSRCPASRVTAHHADALTFTCPPGTDLVVTHFFLDCLTQSQVETLVRRVTAQLSPGALWLLSDFRIPAHGLRRALARAYISALYYAFRVLTGLRVSRLPDPQKALSAAGFMQLAEHRRFGGLLYTELWSLGAAHAQTPAAAKIEMTAMTEDPNAHQHPPLEKPADAIPDPEPIAPSLGAPDPGVFHHEAGVANKPDGENLK